MSIDVFVIAHRRRRTCFEACFGNHRLVGKGEDMAVVSATAMGTAYVLYRWTKGKPCTAGSEDEDGQGAEGMAANASTSATPVYTTESRGDALRAGWNAFVWSMTETVGKWRLSDLTLGWMYLARQEDDVRVRLRDAVHPKKATGEAWIRTLVHARRAARLCHTTREKKWEDVFAKLGVEGDDLVAIQQKSGVLRPAYVVVRDEALQSILLVVRGTHGFKDMLTCISGFEQPHHAHTQENHETHLEGYMQPHHHRGAGERPENPDVDEEGCPEVPTSPSADGSRTGNKESSAFCVEVGDVVLGYAHTGMLTAARSLLKSVKKDLLKAMEVNPGFSLQIVGHSMGGGTAALLTMMLRADPQFKDATCIAFATPACVTRELGESCAPYVTTIINGSDVVPTISAAAVDSLREEVLSSGWYSSWKEDIAKTRVAAAIKGGVQQLHAASMYVVSKTPFVRTTGQYAAIAAASSFRGAGAAAGWLTSRRLGFSCFGPASSSYTDLSVATGLSIEDDDEDEGLAPDPLSMERSSLSEELSQEAAEEMGRLAEARISARRERRKMYPPGRILHMVPVKKVGEEGESSENGQAQLAHELYHDIPAEFYGHLHLCKNMVRDHFIPRYLEALDYIIQDL